ncbi:MAG: cysteine-rich KTR domain-containing protein [Bifidobacterium catenulatum]
MTPVQQSGCGSKCRRETIINVKQFHTTVIKEPDA